MASLDTAKTSKTMTVNPKADSDMTLDPYASRKLFEITIEDELIKDFKIN